MGTFGNDLTGVTAVSSSDVWAVGYSSSGTAYRTLVERWNGTSWAVVTSPNMGTNDNKLLGVAAVSANEVWAAGYYNSGTTGQTLTERWNGTSWTVVTSSNLGTNHNFFLGVAAVSSGDVWAVGYYFNGSSISQTLIEHWNGSTWTLVSQPQSWHRLQCSLWNNCGLYR